MLRIIFGAAALLAAGQSNIVSAQDRLPDIRVTYGDLDLTTEDGVDTLDRRLNHAVEQACPSSAGIADMSRLRGINECRATKRQEVAGLRGTALAQARLQGKSVALAAQK